MAKYLVQKSGPLHGEVKISGAKNAVLPIMEAALLTKEECIITNVPDLSDVKILSELLTNFGAEVKKIEKNALSITVDEIKSSEAPYDLTKKIRASITCAGPLLARNGYAKVYMPGGDAIGKRPIDLHIKGFKDLGALVNFNEVESYVEISCDKLKGAEIFFDSPSVGATENVMMAAVLAEGTTSLWNPAREPEIVDLANFLNKMGAKIRGAGTGTIKIEGVKELKGCRHGIIPDRIETGTFMVAAAITRGEIVIKNAVYSHVRAIAAKLSECGVVIEEREEGIYVSGKEKPLVPTDVKTMPYPRFPTDIQSPFMAFLMTVEGDSIVEENLYEKRFMHAAELNRMGADIVVEDRRAVIHGGKRLEGTVVAATDVRAGACMVLAGLVAEGTTEVLEVYHIERGYENFIEKFKALGATILRIDDVN